MGDGIAPCSRPQPASLPLGHFVEAFAYVSSIGAGTVISRVSSTLVVVVVRVVVVIFPLVLLREQLLGCLLCGSLLPLGVLQLL